VPNGGDPHVGDEMHVDPDIPDSPRFEDVRQKRKIAPDFPNAQDASTVKRDLENKPGPSNLKKPRLASPKPVVVDEFEREAKREVAASAGLTGGVESGTRLELRHQVGVEPAN
jgi:ATP-dependent RNA helicase DOB1